MFKKLVPIAVAVLVLVCLSVGTAYYQGWLGAPDGGTPDQATDQTNLKGEGADGSNTGGTPNKPLRETSPNVTILEPGSLHSPDLPAGGKYRIFTFQTKGEETFIFTAANTTGYGLFAASSPTVVEDESGRRSLPPFTTFQAIWRNGSQSAGEYTGTNKDLLLRDDAGNNYFLSTYSRSAAIPGLRDLGDGHSISMPGDAMPAAGTDVLWLNFTTPTGDTGFIVVADTPPQAQPERKKK